MGSGAEDPTERLRALAAATARRLAEKKGIPQAAWESEGSKRRRTAESHLDWTCANCSAHNYGHRSACYRCGMPRGQGVMAERRHPEEPSPWRAAAEAAAYASGAGGLPAVENTFTVIEVPESYVGLLIGKGGHDIRQLQERTGASVCVGKLSFEGSRKVCLNGSAEAQAAAEAIIKRKLMEWAEKDAYKPITDYILVPQKFAPRLIGPQGCVINQVKDACGVTARIDDDEHEDQSRKLYLKGTPEGVARAREQVERILLDLYRRSRIFNAPLESKYGMQEGQEPPKTEPPSGPGFTRPYGVHEQFIAAQEKCLAEASMWAEHYAGNLDCVDFYRKLERLQEVEAIPGMD